VRRICSRSPLASRRPPGEIPERVEHADARFAGRRSTHLYETCINERSQNVISIDAELQQTHNLLHRFETPAARKYCRPSEHSLLGLGE
jgi:hypothetical protein